MEIMKVFLFKTSQRWIKVFASFSFIETGYYLFIDNKNVWMSFFLKSLFIVNVKNIHVINFLTPCIYKKVIHT